MYYVQLYTIYHQGPYIVKGTPSQGKHGPEYPQLVGVNTMDGLRYIEDDYSNTSGYRFNPRLLEGYDQQVIYDTIKYLEHLSTEQLINQTSGESDGDLFKNGSKGKVTVYYTHQDIVRDLDKYYT